MKYFLDTEFSESGSNHPIQLISIGIVREDGKEFYAETDQFNPSMCNKWVRENVLPNLTGYPKYRLATIQWCDALNNPRLPSEGYVRGELIRKSERHNALEDARWVRLCWYFLAGIQQAHDLELARSLD